MFTQCVTPSNPDSITAMEDPPRQTSKAHASTRHVIPDEFAACLEKDRLLSYEVPCQKINGKKVDISVPVIALEKTSFSLFKVRISLASECIVNPITTNGI